ncbi:hypothetical protein [Flavicella marina]|uniref:hypothetical protein n=1 Tax=Flavicella marina TaxID=1475951 RepID=UPI0012653F07|nr:hypothetical protein [Flavicella marina]
MKLFIEQLKQNDGLCIPQFNFLNDFIPCKTNSPNRSYIVDEGRLYYEEYMGHDHYIKKNYFYKDGKLDTIIENMYHMFDERTYQYSFEYFDDDKILMKKVLTGTSYPMEVDRVKELFEQGGIIYAEQIGSNSYPKKHSKLVETKMLDDLQEYLSFENTEAKLNFDTDNDWKYLNIKDEVVFKTEGIIITKKYRGDLYDKLFFDTAQGKYEEESFDLKIFKKSKLSGKWILHCLRSYIRKCDYISELYGYIINKTIDHSWSEEPLLEKLGIGYNLVGTEYFYFDDEDFLQCIENDYFIATIDVVNLFNVKIERGRKLIKSLENLDSTVEKSEFWYEIIEKESESLEELLSEL